MGIFRIGAKNYENELEEKENYVKVELMNTYYKNTLDEHDKIGKLTDRELLEKIYSKLINVEFFIKMLDIKTT